MLISLEFFGYRCYNDTYHVHKAKRWRTHEQDEHLHLNNGG